MKHKYKVNRCKNIYKISKINYRIANLNLDHIQMEMIKKIFKILILIFSLQNLKQITVQTKFKGCLNLYKKSTRKTMICKNNQNKKTKVSRDNSAILVVIFFKTILIIDKIYLEKNNKTIFKINTIITNSKTIAKIMIKIK